jgi:SOS response regulatory protein OraA/RecX
MSLASLQRYGEWYYTRYFPSRAFLREKIMKKCPDSELVQSVMDALSPLFIEKNIIESRVHDAISQGKTIYHIRQKLKQKKFDTALTEEVLEGFIDIFQDDETYRKVIETFCQKAQKK